MGIQSRSEIVVRYAETDQMAIAWHGHYLAWLEVARLDWWRSLGMSYKELEDRGYLLPVLKVECEFCHSAHFDDRLTIEVNLSEYTGFRIVFSYMITRARDGQKIAVGKTHHVITDRSMRPLRVERHIPDIHTRLANAL